VVEVLAALAVQPLRVVLADAAPVHLPGHHGEGPWDRAAWPPGSSRAHGAISPYHAVGGGGDPAERGALGGVPVAEAVPAQHQLVERVVVLLLDLPPRVQQVVPQRVQLGEVHPQVGDAQQVWGRGETHVSTESQNGRGWKGPLWVI